MKWCTFWFLAILGAVKCSRILIVFPFAAPSHYILGSSLAKGLAEAGHDVTMVSPFGERTPPKNLTYRDIVLTGFLEERKKENFNLFDMENVNPFLGIHFISVMGIETTTKTFEHPNFQKLLNSGEKFDAVIVEQFHIDALHGLAYHFNASLILFSTIAANSWINPLVGNPSPPSYIPDITLKYSSKMTFMERVHNWLFITVSQIYRHFFCFPVQNRIMKEYLPGVPDLDVVNYNASLMLLNSHESIHQAVPHVPNMIDIGGYHVNPVDNLPWDVQRYMDESKEGVVYFSMGSNIKPTDMPVEKRDIILKVLGNIKQNVLWKWNEDEIPGKPSNVKLFKWLPQQDVLGHKNTKLFITHGGLLSTIETVYHGVPILSFPIFGDQKANALRAKMDGYGLTLPFSDITEEKLAKALDLLLNNPKYRKNAKRRSRLMKDRPVKPMELAIYWVEYVIRHGGAPHLRVAGVDLPWYKYLLVDVILFVVLVAVGSVAVFCLVVRKLCCRKAKTKKVKRN